MNFTKRSIEALPLPASGRAVYRDDSVGGLGLLVQASGYKSFFWQRKVNGYPHRETIGAFPDLSVENARARASDLNSRLAKWKSTAYESENPFAERVSVTLDELVEEYILKHLREHSKNPVRAEKMLRWMIKKYLTPLRSRKISAIRHEDLADFHRRAGTKHGHRSANHVIKTIRTLFNFARRAKLFRGENPALGIQLYFEPKRTRFLQPNELPKLWEALSKSENTDLRDFVNLALWTGAWKSNIFAMRWQDISLEDNKWIILDPKNRTPYQIPLTPEAVAILTARKFASGASHWVFPSRASTARHLVDLKHSWKKLLKEAGLHHPGDPDLRLTIHDLRRTNASWQAAQGTALTIIGKSLGHSSLSATAIYAQVNLDSVRASMTSANAAISAAMQKKPLLVAAPKRKKRA